MSVISLTYEGDEILPDVVIADAEFEAQTNGLAGLCRFRVKDDSHAYVPGYFHAGGVLNLRIDDQLVWAGYVMSVGRLYAFPVDDTTAADQTPRFWDIQGADWNILFQKRVVWKTDDPTGARDGWPIYDGGTQDATVVLDIVNNYMDLSSDGLDFSGVRAVGPVSAFGEEFRPISNYGEVWGSVMNKIIASTGAVYYIDPNKVLQFRDVELPTAPYGVSDRPASFTGTVGCRNMQISASATDMVNDALVWGAGVGSDQMVFYRATDTETVDYYGLFQWGDLMSDVWTLNSVSKRAQSMVYGSKTNLRGHREPAYEVKFTLFEPGLQAGMVVEFDSAVFDESFLDDVTITDPVGTVPANLANFMERIRHIESNGVYTRQNSSSGAYGAYQIMPGNWKGWACDALGYPRSMGISAKDIDPSDWFPPPTQANQDATATNKFTNLYHWLGDWRRVAAFWRAGHECVRQPNEWARGTIFYVNHACVPLGFPETTTSTLLPPVGETA